ncbi:MAG: acylphosphatase [bacterium]
MDQQRMELSIKGRVQGVGFRNFTVKTAKKLSGTTGWVKNESDGTVSLVAEGPMDELDTLKEAVEEGPSFANVTGIEENRTSPTGTFDTFKVRY